MESSDLITKGAILQRDKESYAIIPRTPAGILTPELLKKIACAAEEFKIPVLKIVSGQRIAMVGVKKEDIEEIWRFLGTDSGQAIGLCFHYVQACPGNSLCKYGVQDSIGLALELEKKYYGTEFPAKMKIGVSGCTICCSESYLRDIGIVGKKSGWTLSLGGNSGSNPRIGNVIVQKLTEEELFTIIDKFLTYYIKYAKKKERTSKFIKRIGIDEVRKNLGLPF